VESLVPPQKWSITVQGIERIEREILRRSKRARDPAPAFIRLTFDLRSIMKRQFDEQGGFLGSRWAALAPNTVKRKKRRRKTGHGGDPRILHDFTRLRKSYTVGTERYVHTSMDSFEVMSLVPYVGFHMTGTKFMPQRKVFEFNTFVKRRWTKAVQNYIARGIVTLPPL
jgi:hypothetical protein